MRLAAYSTDVTGESLRAIIFDFNGVIADDEMTHLECFQQALSEAGLVLSKKEYYGPYLGMDERTCAAALLTRRGGSCDPALHARIIERKAALFHNHTAGHQAALFLRSSECLVIEDSRAGIQAGVQAGMRVLAAATTYPSVQLTEAHLILPTLDGVDPADLARRLFQPRSTEDCAGWGKQSRQD